MFNAEKYAALLEGLEITIKQFSELSNSDDDTLRFDAEHYQYHYLAMVNQLKLHQHSKLLDLIRKPVITGHTPSMQIDRFYDGNIAFIKTDNLRENQIVDSYTDYLTKAGDAELKSSRLKLKDILVTIIGATPAIVGRCAIVREEHLPANINQNIALIEADDTKINPNYLNIYLNSKFGRGMLNFHSRQTEQVNLNCREVERVLVPLFPKLEVVISNLSNQSSKLKATSKELYAEAEQVLLEAVGLADFKPSPQNTNIKNLAQSMGSSGRLDAEYYQPKYDAYIQQIKNYKHGFKSITEVLTIPIKNGTTPSSVTSGYNASEHYFVRVEAFQENLTIDETLFNSLDKEDYQKYKANLTIKNDILVSMTGTIGAVVIYSPEKPALINQNIMRLRCNESIINTESLSIYLKTIGKVLLERVQTGNVQPYVNTSNFETLIVPIIDLKTQTHISELVQQSFTLKAQSEHLLSVAKRAVEIAIEQDETAAMHFIENSTNLACETYQFFDKNQ